MKTTYAGSSPALGTPETAGPDPVIGRHGLVVRVDGIACTVLMPDGARRRARLTGKIARQRVATAPVVVGDEVILRRLDDATDLVEATLPRRTELVRAAAGGLRGKQVIAANLDLLVIVFALAQPAPVPARLDRMLVIAEQAGIPPLIVLNKIDLADDPTQVAEVFALYRQLGYALLATSTVTGQGLDELRRRLVGRLSALVGASGVGKSSLLNAIQPGLRLRAADVSRTGKGRHTTSAADLLSLPEGGYVADTPGLKEIGLWGIAPDDLVRYFPEFAPHLGGCRFARCSHLHEPDCPIRAAVADGRIATSRYQSFVKLREEVALAG